MLIRMTRKRIDPSAYVVWNVMKHVSTEPCSMNVMIKVAHLKILRIVQIALFSMRQFDMPNAKPDPADLKCSMYLLNF